MYKITEPHKIIYTVIAMMSHHTCSQVKSIDSIRYFHFCHKTYLVAERFAVELSLPVLTTRVCLGWDSKTQHSACDANGLIDCATAAAQALSNLIYFFSILRIIENETDTISF